MFAIIRQHPAQIGALAGIILAFAFVRNSTVPLMLAIPMGIAIIYLTVLAVGFAFGRLER